jgi:endonuclease YncB( thermonuclease family)
MPTNTVLSPSSLNKLVSDIRGLITGGRQQAQRATNIALISTYWKVGERIISENLTENAGYGDAVMDKLAESLDIDRSTLVRSVQFAKAYPRGVPQNDLTWSHYRLLLTVQRDKERRFYQDQAEKNHWTREQLAKAIDTEVVVDPNKKPSKQLKRPTGGPFIYRAEVLKVIDGDTLLVRLDLGFQVLKDQRIRLAEIDAPSPEEDGGPEAKEYVQTQMAKAKAVAIRTIKIDIYGRYVGHVFYSQNEGDDWEKVFTRGQWLNEELISLNLVQVK